ncbi:hypothetical protein EON63_07045 [archaeon]|nr:MAG: hypothetical protein EON63_07045 [archaeon]
MDTVQRLYKEAQAMSTTARLPLHRGIYKVFFAGVEPRVMWISIGGFVFFGAYEQTLKMIS